ncbi:hypothetical protein AAFF_G00167520 [Aldrovandia affinis]|uniref:Uncharacterized protein n=1 Tax=Aldrovandia affinis TaxID=143900 RepID=A0AAD7R198_9TELE|nr:hypothetical protein AAFF_G00167520 [Aldrovandia affinis]
MSEEADCDNCLRLVIRMSALEKTVTEFIRGKADIGDEDLDDTLPLLPFHDGSFTTWEKQGAKPKKSSTPFYTELWKKSNNRRSRKCLFPSARRPLPVEQSNRYSVLSLDDFPPLPEHVAQHAASGIPADSRLWLYQH